jgi:hypothetical protein
MESFAEPMTGTSAQTVRSREFVYNDRGIIAENYRDLQGLGVLEVARNAYPLRRGSGESLLRAIFQSAEIALLNLVDTTARATSDLQAGRCGAALVKLVWARGFHRLLVRLGLAPHSLGIAMPSSGAHGVLRIHDSPAFTEYLDALRKFDATVAASIQAGALDPETVIAERSLDDPQYHLFHLAKVCNHECTVWEQRLREVPIPVPVPSYEEFVVAGGVRDAVYDRVLSGDTYFTQFRGLHQIPETLGEEVNDRLEEVIRALRASNFQKAAEDMACVNKLADVIAAAVIPMADNLAASDYHEIRENLGLTSGSHSVGLRFHMFTHLYEELSEELSRCALRLRAGAASAEDALREMAQGPAEFQEWLLSIIGSQCLSFRASITEWRDEHVHLPRNNLGGAATKSLTGSPDALQAVKHMRDAANVRDAMAPLVRSRNISPERADGSLTRYLDSESSLDTLLLTMTGNATQRRFVQVQERLGFFANRCPFSAPPRRKA